MNAAVCLLILSAVSLFSATPALNPATGTADEFFGITNLYTFHLRIAPDQWAIMEETDQCKPNAQPLRGGFAQFLPFGEPANRPGPGRPGPAGFGHMGIDFKEGTATLEFQGRRFGDICVRFKGNSSYNFSRNSLKRSLKLDFNDLEKGKKFFGLTKLNLNNNAMDPSQMREALAYDIFRHDEVPAARTAYAKLYLTIPGKHKKVYAGLYTVVEQVDERFLKKHFGAKEALLLKPERLPGLPYLGDDWSAYTNRAQPKSNVKPKDAERFIQFAKFLNQSDDARFQTAIADYVDVDQYLRFLALQALLSNLDSPLITGHNYYLCLHPNTRQFTWIPWDLNEAFGGFGPPGTVSDQAELSIDQPFSRVNQLAVRLLQVPSIKERYHQIVRGLLATNFNSARLNPLIDAIANTIRPALGGDKMVLLTQFETAIADRTPSTAVSLRESDAPGFRSGGPRGPGGRRYRAPLKSFIKQRHESVLLQLEGKKKGDIPREIRPGPNGPRVVGPLMGFER